MAADNLTTTSRWSRGALHATRVEMVLSGDRAEKNTLVRCGVPGQWASMPTLSIKALCWILKSNHSSAQLHTMRSRESVINWVMLIDRTRRHLISTTGQSRLSCQRSPKLNQPRDEPSRCQIVMKTVQTTHCCDDNEHRPKAKNLTIIQNTMQWTKLSLRMTHAQHGSAGKSPPH